jgi:hypothetical protein
LLIQLVKKAFKVIPRIQRNNSEVYSMARMRYDPKTGNFEWEGTAQELLEIYDGLKQRSSNTLQIGNSIPRRYDIPRKLVTSKIRLLPSDYDELEKKMPTVEELVAYVLSKPKYEHDIVDIGKKFFGKQINSRKYGKLYRDLSANLDRARKSIEATQRGAFEQRPAPNRNLRIFSFKQVNATLLGTSQHPSP